MSLGRDGYKFVMRVLHGTVDNDEAGAVGDIVRKESMRFVATWKILGKMATKKIQKSDVVVVTTIVCPMDWH